MNEHHQCDSVFYFYFSPLVVCTSSTGAMTSIMACIICHKNHHKLQSLQQESTSGLTLFALFERILGFSLELDFLPQNIVCPECVERFKNYDESFQRAERAANELLELFGSKITSINPYEYSLQVKSEIPAVEHDAAPSMVPVNEVDAITSEPTPDLKCSTTDSISNQPALAKPRPGRPPLLTCIKCNCKFKSYANIADHVCQPNTKRFICDICGQDYKTKSALVIHMLIHSGKRRHNCKFCEKSFTQRVALARHMPIHTGEMNYQVQIKILYYIY